MLTYEIPSYITVDSHWWCLCIILRHQIKYSGIMGAKLAHLACFYKFLALEIMINLIHNRLKHTLAYQFQSYMTKDSHWIFLDIILRDQIKNLDLVGEQNLHFWHIFEQFIALEVTTNTKTGNACYHITVNHIWP